MLCKRWCVTEGVRAEDWIPVRRVREEVGVHRGRAAGQQHPVHPADGAGAEAGYGVGGAANRHPELLREVAEAGRVLVA